MKNKNLLIGAGVVIVGYLLWKKSQGKNNMPSVSNSTLESKRKEAQSNLDMLSKITDDFNKNSKQEKRNGILYQVDNSGKDIGFWTDNNNFTRTDGKDKLIEQYKKNIKDLGFTFLGRKVLTPAEYEIEKSKMF
jgi:hypothetical protein